MHAGDIRSQRDDRANIVAGRADVCDFLPTQGVVVTSTLRALVISTVFFMPQALATQTSPATSVAVSPVSSTGLMQVTLGLGAVVALILLLAWLVRRFGPMQRGGSATVRLIGGVSLGQRERAVLVQVGTKQLLLGVAPGNVRTLHVFDEPVAEVARRDEEGAPMRARGGFAERLQAALGERIRS